MKIGFAVLTHDDYYDALAQQLTHQAIQTLTDAGIELVVSDSPLTSQHDAVQSSVSFLGQDVDGVILFIILDGMSCSNDTDPGARSSAADDVGRTDGYD